MLRTRGNIKDLRERLLDPEYDNDPPFARATPSTARTSTPPINIHPLSVSSIYAPNQLKERGLADSNTFFENNWQLEAHYKKKSAPSKQTMAVTTEKKADNNCGKWFSSLFEKLTCCESKPEETPVQDKSYTLF